MLISKAVAVILITLCPFLIVNQSCIRTVLFCLILRKNLNMPQIRLVRAQMLYPAEIFRNLGI